ncbi:MAG: SPASM domain-containing protein [Candidatus Thermoplasmatota archaeon]|nr:SPASM domain-containing protein [Candidatus Thermoplasmatota archaeon]
MKESKYNFKLNVGEKSVIYNALNDSITQLDSEAIDLLEKKDFDKFPPDCLNELISGGVLVEDEMEEMQKYRYLVNKHRYQSNVYIFTIVTSHICNLKCTYCYEGGGWYNKAMSEKEAENVVNFMKGTLAKKAHRGLSVLFYGGEPLVAEKACVKIAQDVSAFCDETGLETYLAMATNGTLITEKTIEKLFAPYNFKVVQITLDGNRKDHNSRRMYKDGSPTYDIILSAIKMLDDASVPVHIRLNIDKKNIEGLNDLFDDLKSLNLKRADFYYSPIYSMTEECKHMSEVCLGDSELLEVQKSVYPEMKKTGMAATIRPVQHFGCMFETDDSFVIDPYMDIYKCLTLMNRERDRVGYLDDEGKMRLLPRFYDVMSRSPLNNGECLECPYLPLCNGGCAAQAVDRTGSYHGTVCTEEKVLLKDRLEQYCKGKFEGKRE